MKKILTYISILIFFIPKIFAFSGQYEGTLNFGIQKLRIITEFAKTQQKNIGLLYSIDQSSEAIPMSSITIKDDKLSFEIKQLNIQFTGQIKDNIIKGKFTQFGKTIPLTLTKNAKEKNIKNCLEFSVSEKTLNALAGNWYGTIKPNVLKQLRLKLIFEKANKKIKGFLISINQSSAKIPITDISEKNGKINISISSIGAHISAKISGDNLNAKFRQNKFSQGVIFKKEK